VWYGIMLNGLWTIIAVFKMPKKMKIKHNFSFDIHISFTFSISKL